MCTRRSETRAIAGAALFAIVATVLLAGIAVALGVMLARL